MAGRGPVRITADTNVLIRAAVAFDDPNSEDGRQGREATALLRHADLIVVTIPALCEFVWVLRRIYKFDAAKIGIAIRALCSARSVVCDRLTVEAGLAWMKAGGDFADGAIAAIGKGAGADTFVSFDSKALRAARRVGARGRVPSEMLTKDGD